jgi:hypothetical protein
MTSVLKRAEPVTLVRSPMLTKEERRTPSFPSPSGERAG